MTFSPPIVHERANFVDRRHPILAATRSRVVRLATSRYRPGRAAFQGRFFIIRPEDPGRNHQALEWRSSESIRPNGSPRAESLEISLACPWFAEFHSHGHSRELGQGLLEEIQAAFGRELRSADRQSRDVSTRMGKALDQASLRQAHQRQP